MTLPVKHHEHQLTHPQQEAFTQIAGFLHSHDKAFIIKGYAGTGKTYLIRILARYLKKLDRQFFLIAPTGRAARILAAKSGFTASTIHSLIYGEAKESKEITEGKETLTLKFKLRANQHDSDAVYIIDEASMISDAPGTNDFLTFGSGRLLKDFLSHISLLSSSKIPNNGRQVLIVGDPAQLPPVQQPESIALSSDYLLEQYDLPAGEITLTEVVRQKADSSVLQLATSIRSHLVSSSLSTDAFLPASAFKLTEAQMTRQWKELTSSGTEEETILITATNKQALYYNSLLRRLKYNTPFPPLQIGDRLLVTNNNRLFGLLNGDIVEITKMISYPEEFTIAAGENGGVSFTFRDVEIAYRDEFNEITTLECKIMETLLTGASPSLSAEEWQALKLLANQIHKIEPPPKNLKRKNPELYHQMEEEYKETLKTSPYLNAVQVKFGYAITCHKSQGGEWNNVFLDFRSFQNQSSEEYFRWAYTAVTRAKENIYCLNLPFMYGR